jgi:uncharacterized membrane protein
MICRNENVADCAATKPENKAWPDVKNLFHKVSFIFLIKKPNLNAFIRIYAYKRIMTTRITKPHTEKPLLQVPLLPLICALAFEVPYI